MPADKYSKIVDSFYRIEMLFVKAVYVMKVYIIVSLEEQQQM